VSEWNDLIDIWRARLNVELPSEAELGKKAARVCADELMSLLAQHVKHLGRVAVPELGVFHRVDLKPRTTPTGGKAPPTSHIRFRAGHKARWQAPKKLRSKKAPSRS